MRGVAGGRECLINLVAPRVSKSLIFEMAFLGLHPLELRAIRLGEENVAGKERY